MKRVFLVVAMLLVAMVLLFALAPLAFAATDPAGCVTTYAGTASNPPDDANPLICDDKFCSGGVGVRPNAVGRLANYESGAAGALVTCVV